MNKKIGLGKGLGALLPGSDEAPLERPDRSAGARHRAQSASAPHAVRRTGAARTGRFDPRAWLDSTAHRHAHRRRSIHAHRRRAPLARRAAGRAGNRAGRHQRCRAAANAGNGAGRKCAARRSQCAGRGAGLQTSERRVRPDAGSDRAARGQEPRGGRQHPAPAETAGSRSRRGWPTA